MLGARVVTLARPAAQASRSRAFSAKPQYKFYKKGATDANKTAAGVKKAGDAAVVGFVALFAYQLVSR